MPIPSSAYLERAAITKSLCCYPSSVILSLSYFLTCVLIILSSNNYVLLLREIQPTCCSVGQSCPTFQDLMDYSMPGFFPVLHHLLELAQTHVHLVSDAIQPSHPLLPLLLPSIFPSIKVFSIELALHIRWPKYGSFIFSINLSNKYPGLIFFRIDWFDLLAVQGMLKSLLQHHSSNRLWFVLLNHEI